MTLHCLCKLHNYHYPLEKRTKIKPGFEPGSYECQSDVASSLGHFQILFRTHGEESNCKKNHGSCLGMRLMSHWSFLRGLNFKVTIYVTQFKSTQTILALSCNSREIPLIASHKSFTYHGVRL